MYLKPKLFIMLSNLSFVLFFFFKPYLLILLNKALLETDLIYNFKYLYGYQMLLYISLVSPLYILPLTCIGGCSSCSSVFQCAAVIPHMETRHIVKLHHQSGQRPLTDSSESTYILLLMFYNHTLVFAPRFII